MHVVHGGEVRIDLSREELQKLLDTLGDAAGVVIRIPLEDAFPLYELSQAHTYGEPEAPGEAPRKHFTISTTTFERFLKEE